MLLCWLRLLLIRIAENGTGQTWHRLRWELEKMHLGRFTGRAGLVHPRTGATTEQRTIFRALALDEPPRFFHLEAADSASVRRTYGPVCGQEDGNGNAVKPPGHQPRRDRIARSPQVVSLREIALGIN